MEVKPTALVTLVTSKGNIEMELFPKELPQLCREFIGNCVNKKYVGVEFAQVTPNLIQTLQIETSTNIKREKNPRIKFSARGAVGLLRVADTPYSSASGFFISLQPVAEYSSDYVFIGNVVGESIYNVLKIKDLELKPGSESPLYPIKITDCIVSQPFFDDLVERTESSSTKKRKRPKAAVKLDYGDEEEEIDNSAFVVRSAHELLGNKTKPTKIRESEPADDADLKKTEATETPVASGNEEVQKNENPELSETSEKHGVAGSSAAGPETIEEEEQGPAPKRKKTVRDPTIDPPFDPELDISEDEISYETLRNHKFICR